MTSPLDAITHITTTANATRPASATSPRPNTLTSGAETTKASICHNPVSKKPGQHHPKGTGQERWMNRWKPALNAFAITFEGRLF